MTRLAIALRTYARILTAVAELLGAPAPDPDLPQTAPEPRCQIEPTDRVPDWPARRPNCSDLEGSYR